MTFFDANEMLNAEKKMTFDTNEILKRLENGENVNDIAAAAANAINDALKLQEKKKKEAEAKKKANREAKVKDFGFLIEGVIEFFQEYYPELLKENVPEAKIKELAEELVDIFDKAYDETMAFMKSDVFEKMVKNRDNDAIGNFLKENGLI